MMFVGLITDAAKQKIKVVVTKGKSTVSKTYSLTELTLATE